MTILWLVADVHRTKDGDAVMPRAVWNRDNTSRPKEGDSTPDVSLQGIEEILDEFEVLATDSTNYITHQIKPQPRCTKRKYKRRKTGDTYIIADSPYNNSLQNTQTKQIASSAKKSNKKQKKKPMSSRSKKATNPNKSVKNLAMLVTIVVATLTAWTGSVFTVMNCTANQMLRDGLGVKYANHGPWCMCRCWRQWYLFFVWILRFKTTIVSEHYVMSTNAWSRDNHICHIDARFLYFQCISNRDKIVLLWVIDMYDCKYRKSSNISHN